MLPPRTPCLRLIGKLTVRVCTSLLSGSPSKARLLSMTARNILMVGNPGVGTSTILNSLVRTIKFASGITAGTGLTEVLQVVDHNGTKYMDTPG